MAKLLRADKTLASKNARTALRKGAAVHLTIVPLTRRLLRSAMFRGMEAPNMPHGVVLAFLVTWSTFSFKSVDLFITPCCPQK